MKLAYLFFAICCFFTLGHHSLWAQYDYSVSTLLPESSQLLDDGICLDENGNLYGSYWGIWQGAAGRHVLRYRPDGSYDTLATGFVRPNGMSYHRGSVYVADGGNGRIARIDTNGQVSTLATLDGVSNVIPVPGTDSLIATSWGRNQVFGISAEGTVSVLSSSALYSGPVGAAIDSLGRLYVANFNNGRIVRLGESGPEVFTNVGGGIGFIYHDNGSILATSHSTKKVYRIPIDDPEGIEVIAGSGQAAMIDGVGDLAAFRSPNGIIATPSGDTIYVSEFAGKALRMIVRTPSAVSSVSEEPLAEEAVVVYPMPNNGLFRIKYDLAMKIHSGNVRNINGQVVAIVSGEEIEGGTIDLSNLPPGKYRLEIMNESGVAIVNRSLLIVR